MYACIHEWSMRRKTWSLHTLGVSMYVCVCMHAYMNGQWEEWLYFRCVQECTCVCMYVRNKGHGYCILHVCLSMYACMHVCVYITWFDSQWCSVVHKHQQHSLNVWIRICMNTHMHAYIMIIYTHTYIYKSTCLHIHVYITGVNSHWWFWRNLERNAVRFLRIFN